MTDFIKLRARSIAIALTMLAMAFGAPTLASAQTDSVEGEWHLASSNAEGEIDEAIHRVTNRMNVFIRGIANSRIDDAVNPERRVRIQRNGENVRLWLDDWNVQARVNGPVVRVRASDGTPLRVRATESHGNLVIQQMAEDGGRVVYFQVNGDRLVMATRIQSERLPEDITYRLQYRRAGGSGALASR